MAKRKVLVVAEDTRLATTLVSWLRESGCDLAVRTSYRAGREHLDTQPAIVIAQVKLGAYNGLHLALRARARGIPAVVFGDANAATEREAEQVGAIYLDSACLDPTSLRKDEVQSLIRTAFMPLPDASPLCPAMPASCENAETARGIGTFGGS